MKFFVYFDAYNDNFCTIAQSIIGNFKKSIMWTSLAACLRVLTKRRYMLFWTRSALTLVTIVVDETLLQFCLTWSRPISRSSWCQHSFQNWLHYKAVHLPDDVPVQGWEASPIHWRSAHWLPPRASNTESFPHQMQLHLQTARQSHVWLPKGKPLCQHVCQWL